MTIPRMYAHSLIGDTIEAKMMSYHPNANTADCISCGSPGVGPYLLCRECEARDAAALVGMNEGFDDPPEDGEPEPDSSPIEGPSELSLPVPSMPPAGPLPYQSDMCPPARCPFCKGYAHARACAPLHAALFSETRCPSCGDPSYGRLCCACLESGELAREDILVAAAAEIYTKQQALDAILRLRANAAWFAKRAFV